MRQRSLAWKLNWYRQSELEGALLLGRMVRQADDAELVRRLTEHCADEARHAWLWTQTLEQLQLPTIRILRSYQSFYMQRGGMPASVPDVLALTHVFEQRVQRQFSEELRDPQLPPPARHTFEIMLADERQHLQWVRRWLEDRPDSAALLARYREIDQHVYDELCLFQNRLWDVPGLGEMDQIWDSRLSAAEVS